MKKYDFIIAGGGTAGCAAAYTAGKAGYNTLLVEKNIHLGGTITSGLVVPCMIADSNAMKSLNNNFFSILTNELHNLGGQVTYQGNNGWFNPELTKIALDNLMNEANVEVKFSTIIDDVITENNYIKSVKILSEHIETRYIIDATGDCEIGKLAKCEFLDSYIEKDYTQPVSLRFIMSGVDLKTFADWLLEYDKDRNVTTVECIDGNIHLSTAYTWDSDKNWALKPLFDDAVVKGILKDADRNYFQIFTVAGMPLSVAFNCPRMVENTNYSTTLANARQAIFRLSYFCKIYLKGFENAYISNIADELGIRVSNRIKGKYIYTADDLRSGKKFEHPVLISNYPIDIHSKNKNSSTLESIGYYELPAEALMSADIDNLYVAGRCLSAEFEAQAALRIQPNCFSMGEGIVKYIISNS